MAILHVRNVPDDLYARLKRRAEEHRSSLSSEVINLLERAMEEAECAPSLTLAAIRKRRFFNPATVGAPNSTALLRQDRER